MKTRFRELRRNLKRKAEEKIDSLIRGSGYKVFAKTLELQREGFYETNIENCTVADFALSDGLPPVKPLFLLPSRIVDE